MGAYYESNSSRTAANNILGKTKLISPNDLARLETLNHEVPPVLAPKKWRLEALSLIHKISQDVIDSALVAPVLNNIASVITSSFPITFAGIETYDGSKLTFYATSMSNGNQKPKAIENVMPLSNTLAGEVFKRQSTLILSDSQNNNYFVCPSLPIPFHVYHYIGVPLFIDAKPAGVLSIATSHHIIVDKETITWIETAAHHISELLTREAVTTKLKSQENIAVNMLNALSSPTMMCDEHGTIVHVNAAFKSIVEVFHSRMVDENSTNIFRLFDNANQSNSYVHELRRAIKELFDKNKQQSRLDLLLTRAGFHRWYLATMSLMPDSKTAIVMFVDISDRKQAEEQLEHEMLHDQSTGLANRILFHDRVNTSLFRNIANDKSTCVMALEVGRYAFIVESLGHDAADRIIGKVAKRLESIIQTSDIIARVGSSEFAILIEHINDADRARDFALCTIDLFRTPFEIDGQEVILNPSIGIAINATSAEPDAAMLLHDAHAAMTLARENNVTNYEFASVSRSSEAYKKLNRERELHDAIGKDELVVYYQPEIDIKTHNIVGAEALVRWMHPKLGMLQPNTFISLAEESGLIDEIFEKVFMRVVKDAQKLFAHGHELTLWSNISACQFSLNSAPKLLEHHIHNSSVPAHMFGIEITETAVMENSDSASTTLQQLKSLGVTLALDDFGTGYSSLAYLQSFPVDIIKIDRTFISELGKTNASNKIVSAVIGLAHGLRLKALAEGVETAQSVDLLKELGCDLAQGYHFAKPLAFEKLQEYIEKS